MDRDIAGEWHEVLDRAHVITENFDRFVVEHQILETDPELLAHAQNVLMQLADFYQAVGERLDSSDRTSSTPDSSSSPSSDD